MRRTALFAAHVVCTSIVVLVALAVFQGGPAVGSGPCACDPSITASCVGDVNADGVVNLSDSVHLLNYLFDSGPAPAANAFAGPANQLDQSQVDLLHAVLPHLSVLDLPDGVGGTNRTVRFTGVDVQIVNGLGATNGVPALAGLTPEGITNGVGNLIVGYNGYDGATTSTFPRTGSHNIVGGVGNSYASYGGIVVGSNNSLAGPYSSILGGSDNECGGALNVICGGTGNVANGPGNSILGGHENTVDGTASAVVGGFVNAVTGFSSVVVGGGDNSVTSAYSVAVGGVGNSVPAQAGVSVGGQGNLVSGQAGVISGGLNRIITGQYDWAAGGLWQDE